MSEPKRYKPAIDWDITGYEVEGVSMDEVKDGKWVSYSDYARLKAEVERWKFTLEEERQIMREDWAGLRCEKDRVQRALEYAEAQVERLTKAGDAMIDEWWLQLSCPERMKASWMQEQAIVEWNAAKKGGQS